MRLVAGTALGSLALLMTKTCSYRNDTQRMGREGECLLVVFRPGADRSQVEQFERQYVYEPHDTGGWQFREGFVSFVRREVDGQTAHQYCFEPGTSASMRESTRRRLASARQGLRVDHVSYDEE